MALTVAEIKAMLEQADEKEFRLLKHSLEADPRKGVRSAINVAERRIEAEEEEALRIAQLYDYQNSLALTNSPGLLVGLDEVGRGPLAGPLAVGAVVLPNDPRLEGLNDSKKIAPAKRDVIAQTIKDAAIAYSVQYVDPQEIDEWGMTRSLKTAFMRAVGAIEDQGVEISTILLDGNPLHLDSREVNVIKGDAKCASISAASIIAKVERDALMIEYSEKYPEYGWADNKGYGSANHIEAIKKYGVTPMHRKSFCSSFMQPSLF